MPDDDDMIMTVPAPAGFLLSAAQVECSLAMIHWARGMITTDDLTHSFSISDCHPPAVQLN